MSISTLEIARQIANSDEDDIQDANMARDGWSILDDVDQEAVRACSDEQWQEVCEIIADGLIAKNPDILDDRTSVKTGTWSTVNVRVTH